jgi:hypothetical protein
LQLAVGGLFVFRWLAGPGTSMVGLLGLLLLAMGASALVKYRRARPAGRSKD